MSDAQIWLIPGLPLIGAIIAGFFGPRRLREQSHWPVILGCAVACVYATIALISLVNSPHDVTCRISAPSFVWFSAGQLDVQYSIAIDPLTAVMLFAITFIGSWIAVYSIGYLHGDPGYARFFAELGLFVFAMCTLVMADNLLLLYLGWEGVGLCSYLMIGFWFAKPSASAAARKAFLMTRIGDAGMLLGIFLLWRDFGHTLKFTELFDNVTRAFEAAPAETQSTLTLALLLLFCGAIGKSAQFPLHTWLPDAMEGPTPASALIHAATMVTAGVYLVARFMPLYHLAPVAQATVAVIAVITALLAAMIALTQQDVKRVMAYSTISQIGYMFLALGSGRLELAVVGIAAALFHLFTHAFFKALLFLSSGSVMHAMGGVIDMRYIGGLRKVMPVTHATFLCGAASLAAIVPFSGFWSKDDIVDTTWEASHLPNQHLFYLVLFLLAMFTALLTSFYTFRAYFRTFTGDQKIPPEASEHAHGHGHGVSYESPSVMTVPLIVLAVGAVFVGMILGPTHWLAHFLSRTPTYSFLHHQHAGMELNWGMMLASTVIALSGLGLAYLVYVRNPGAEPRFAINHSTLYNLSQNRFYLDEIYRGIVTMPATMLALLSSFLDMLVDGLVDVVGMIPSWIGAALRPIQNGLVQFYALAMVLGLTVFVFILTLRGWR